MNKIIEIKNISFRYSEEEVLDNLSIDIYSGDIVGLLGHNGAGKTTLFRIVRELFTPNEGEINKNYDKGESISILPENNGVYENLTAYENLKFRGKLFGTNNNDIDSNINNLLKLFRLENVKDKKVKTFSNGMKKRIALAAAMIQKSNILILDEPTNGIDPESREILIDIINNLQRQGKTLMISSHDLDFISRAVDRVVIIQNGQKVYENYMDKIKLSLKDIYLKYTVEGSKGNDIY